MDEKIKAASGKPPLGLIPTEALIGPSRVFAYGAAKYAPGNFYQASIDDGAGERYVSAALRHLGAMQEANGLHSYYSLICGDRESGLPHLDHAIASLLMLRVIMIKAGMDLDPGPHVVGGVIDEDIPF